VAGKNTPAGVLNVSGGLQRVFAAVIRASLRFDLASYRRPRLFEALLSVAGVPALCLFGAGAGLYLAGKETMFGELLMVTTPLVVLAMTAGSRRRRLAAELEPRKIAALRSVLPAEAWQTVSREVQANTARSFTGPATLDNVLFWIAGPRLSVSQGGASAARRRRPRHLAAEHTAAQLYDTRPSPLYIRRQSSATGNRDNDEQ
jgi:hypothetical protein